MELQPIDIPTSTSAVFASLKPDGDAFARRLAAAADSLSPGGEDEQARLKTLRKSCEQLVATTFIMPMLARMREDPFKSDLFHGGRTEEIFGQQLDILLAERIVAKADFSIVDSVYRSIAERASLPTEGAQGIETHG